MMSVFGLVVLMACTPSALLDFAIPKWKADRHVRIEDAYKWLYQATRGGEHAAPSEAAARQWLDKEWDSLGPTPDREPLWEPLCPDGRIGRLNLRPFRDRGGSKQNLLQAFLASSREYRQDASSFTEAWSELGRRLKKKSVGNLARNGWRNLDERMKSEGYPAIHHSKSFGMAKRPAYRIITVRELRSLIPEDAKLPADPGLE